MVRIIAIVVCGICLISACSSTPEPIVETVFIEITPTLLPTSQPPTEVADTPTPPPPTNAKELSPTPAPTNSLIPLSDINLESALVHPSDLILEGLFVSSDWIECPDSLFENDKYYYFNDDTILNTASVTYFTDSCEITYSHDYSFSERIYLFESGRQAARFAEKLTEFTEMYASESPYFDIKPTSVNLGENSFWLLRKKGGTKNSYIVMVEDEAVMILELLSKRKIAEEDIVDLSIIMLRAFERSQHP